MRRIPAPDRHRRQATSSPSSCRTASHFPIAFFALELIGAIANKVNPDFRVARARLHPALLGQPGVHLPGNLQRFRLSSAWRASCAPPFQR